MFSETKNWEIVTSNIPQANPKLLHYDAVIP
jgi:hypothetical protein